MNKKLVLYYFDSCPFCQVVLKVLETEFKTTPVIRANILKEPKHKAALLAIGGKTQVPCLVIDGQPLYESQDIITWLRDNA